MFITKREINDKNDKKIQSNLTFYKSNQSTKIGVMIFGVTDSLDFLLFEVFFFLYFRNSYAIYIQIQESLKNAFNIVILYIIVSK